MEDHAALMADIRAEMRGLRTDVRGEITEVRTEIRELRSEMTSVSTGWIRSSRGSSGCSSRSFWDCSVSLCRLHACNLPESLRRGVKPRPACAIPTTDYHLPPTTYHLAK